MLFATQIARRRSLDGFGYTTIKPDRFLEMLKNGEVPARDFNAKFFAVGLVIANDGHGNIVVVWPDSCEERISRYNVRRLNTMTIARL